MTFSKKIKASFGEAIISDHTFPGANYVIFGSSLREEALSFIITSTLDKSIFLSTDGLFDMILVPPGSVLPIEGAANKQGTAKLSFPKGTQFFIKQGPDGVPATGDLSISILHAR